MPGGDIGGTGSGWLGESRGLSRGKASFRESLANTCATLVLNTLVMHDVSLKTFSYRKCHC